MVVAIKELGQATARWLPLLLWMAAIFVVSDQPSQSLPAFGVWNLVIKKGGHFLSYAFLAWLSWRVTCEWPRPMVTAFLITALYAISDEWHQTFVPSRNGTLIDVIVDSAGAIMALLIVYRWRSRRRP